jgi:phosphate transport system substrate-binding protein
MFDNPHSGTARFLTDSVCGGESLSDGARSRMHHAEVVDFVAQTPEALGIIGVNWVSNERDTIYRGFLNKVRIMAVSRDAVATVDNSFQPYQAYLATEQYPLRRDVYVLLTDPRHGLAAGFTSFLASDRGQRIILKAGILPATQPLRIIQIVN